MITKVDKAVLMFWPLCATTVLISCVSLSAGTLFYCSCFGVISAATVVLNIRAKPKAKSAFGPTAFMSWDEVEVYKRFSWYLRNPQSAMSVADLLHLLSLAAIPVLGIALFQHLYACVGILVVTFMIARPIIVTLHPQLYLGDASKAGNLNAKTMLRILNRLKDSSVYK